MFKYISHGERRVTKFSDRIHGINKIFYLFQRSRKRELKIGGMKASCGGSHEEKISEFSHT